MTFQVLRDYLAEGEVKDQTSLWARKDFFFFLPTHVCNRQGQRVGREIEGIPNGGNSMTKILVD